MKRLVLPLLGIGLMAGLVAGGLFLYRERQVEAFGNEAFGTAEERVVQIPQGSGPRQVANLLAEAKVVRDPDLTYRWIRHRRLGPKLKAGEYEFSGALTPAQVMERIVSGAVKVYRFTVPEGLRLDEALPLIAGSELGFDLERLAALAKSPEFSRKQGVPADTLEGFLFPDTYSFPRGTTSEQVLAKMASRTLEEVRRAERGKKPEVNFDLLQAVTLASIVEKETGAVDERPRISCVFHNRLRKDMRLQTDPTVLYAMMLTRGHFTKNITKQDLQTDHPYNTYTRKGLPPGPIASPGAAAIFAAFNPLECADLFFVSKNDGTHVFCPDLRCHEDAVEKWQREFFRKKRPRKAG